MPLVSGAWHWEAWMAASGFDHLGLDERRSLFRLREARVPVAEIASRLGRHRSTIYRELARNRFRDADGALRLRLGAGTAHVVDESVDVSHLQLPSFVRILRYLKQRFDV
jgi:IS30 family transposase